jgi:hypothetical protein
LKHGYGLAAELHCGASACATTPPEKKKVTPEKKIMCALAELLKLQSARNCTSFFSGTAPSARSAALPRGHSAILERVRPEKTRTKSPKLAARSRPTAGTNILIFSFTDGKADTGLSQQCNNQKAWR